MPVVTNLEQKILQLLRANSYSWFTVGVNLGGEPGPSGGSGITPGGFTGQLIQSKVAYDTSEISSLDVPLSLSGASLLHNLNRIRYWMGEKNVKFVIEDDGIEVASGITVIDFVGAPVTAALTSGYTDRVTITISGTGGGAGGSGLALVSADDTVANYLENKVTAGSAKITVTTVNPGGNEEREVDLGTVNITDLNDVTINSAVSGEVLSYTNAWKNLSLLGAGISPVGHSHLEGDITDLEHDAIKIQTRAVSTDAPSEGDALRWVVGASEWTPSGITGGNGESIDAYDEGIPLASGITSLDFTGDGVVASAVGTDITVNVASGGGGGPADFTLWNAYAPNPSAPSQDDEFDDASFDTGLWTEYDVDATMTPNEAEYGFYMSGLTIDSIQGIYQAAPDADWTIYTRVDWLHEQADDMKAGILLLEDVSDLPNSDAYYFALYRGSAGMGFQAEYFLDYNTHSVTDDNNTSDKWTPGAWLRCRQIGTTWYFDYSWDGVHWIQRYTRTERFTVQGFGISQRGSNISTKAIFSAFRYSTNTDISDVMLGDRVNMWRA